MKKLLAVLLCMMLSASLLAGCGGKSSSQGGEVAEDVIKIGVFEPLTGGSAAGGELEVEGIKLANQMHPEVLGKKVELVILDNKSDKAEAATAVSRLIDDGVVSIIGSWGSGYSIAAGDVIKKAEIPAVGTSCTNMMVTKGNPWYFRVCFIDPFQGKIMANYAYNVLGFKTAAIIQEVTNDYSVGLASYFKDAFIELTGDPNSIVEIAQYNTGDTDFSGILTNVKAKNPEVIFSPGNFTECAQIIKQGKKLGITAPFIGGDTWETGEFIEVGGADVEGVLFSTFLFDDKAPLNDKASKFIEEYKKVYPDKTIAAVTALGYDSYIFTLDAIERAGSTDPEAIRQAMQSTKGFEGITGNFDITEDGDADKDIAAIKTIENGEFVFKETFTLK
jgi:branched-chain amino acid transport system substrate-binding protein